MLNKLRRLLTRKEKASTLPELVKYSLWATLVKYCHDNGYPIKRLIP